jgi:hypothetical protein
MTQATDACLDEVSRCMYDYLSNYLRRVDMVSEIMKTSLAP